MTPSHLAQQLSQALNQLTTAIQQTDVDATTLEKASQQLAQLTPQLNQLPESERAPLRPQFNQLLIDIDVAITRLSRIHQANSSTLNASRNRNAAFKAYTQKR